MSIVFKPKPVTVFCSKRYQGLPDLSLLSRGAQCFCEAGIVLGMQGGAGIILGLLGEGQVLLADRRARVATVSLDARTILRPRESNSREVRLTLMDKTSGH